MPLTLPRVTVIYAAAAGPASGLDSAEGRSHGQVPQGLRDGGRAHEVRQAFLRYDTAAEVFSCAHECSTACPLEPAGI